MKKMNKFSKVFSVLMTYVCFFYTTNVLGEISYPDTTPETVPTLPEMGSNVDKSLDSASNLLDSSGNVIGYCYWKVSDQDLANSGYKGAQVDATLADFQYNGTTTQNYDSVLKKPYTIDYLKKTGKSNGLGLLAILGTASASNPELAGAVLLIAVVSVIAYMFKRPCIDPDYVDLWNGTYQDYTLTTELNLLPYLYPYSTPKGIVADMFPGDTPPESGEETEKEKCVNVQMATGGRMSAAKSNNFDYMSTTYSLDNDETKQLSVSLQLEQNDTAYSFLGGIKPNNATVSTYVYFRDNPNGMKEDNPWGVYQITYGWNDKSELVAWGKTIIRSIYDNFELTAISSKDGKKALNSVGQLSIPKNSNDSSVDLEPLQVKLRHVYINGYWKLHVSNHTNYPVGITYDAPTKYRNGMNIDKQIGGHWWVSPFTNQYGKNSLEQLTWIGYNNLSSVVLESGESRDIIFSLSDIPLNWTGPIKNTLIMDFASLRDGEWHHIGTESFFYNGTNSWTDWDPISFKEENNDTSYGKLSIEPKVMDVSKWDETKTMLYSSDPQELANDPNNANRYIVEIK